MKYFIKLAFSICFILGFTFSLQAQDDFEKFTSVSMEDLEKKAKNDCPTENGKNGGGYRAHMPTLGKLPKKVALISFFSLDPGDYKRPLDPKVVQVSTKATPAGLEQISNGLYKLGIDGLEETFKEHGIDLLFPEEFLDTDEKKEFYNSFPLNAKEAKKAKKGFKLNINILDNKDANVGAADGFRATNIHNDMWFTKGKSASTAGHMYGYKNLKTLEIYGYELCKKLEVDAVIFVYNTISVPAKLNGISRFDLRYTSLYMFGPNPVQKDKGLIYSKGVYYGGYRMRMGNGLTISQGVVNTQGVKGYDKILSALANKLCKNMKSKIEK